MMNIEDFAKHLWIEIVQSEEWSMVYLPKEAIDQAEKIITQRVYDLTLHVLENAPVYFIHDPDNPRSHREKLQELLSVIPDITRKNK